MAVGSKADEIEAASAMAGHFMTLLEDGLAARFSGWLSATDGWRDFMQGLDAAGHSPALLALGVVATCSIAFVATAAVARLIVGRLNDRPVLRALAWFAASVVAMLSGSCCGVSSLTRCSAALW